MFYLILASLFLGSALGNIFARLISKSLPISFFRGEIPSFTPELSSLKTFDLLDFGLTVVLTLSIFGINLLIQTVLNKNQTKTKYANLIGIAYAVFAFIIFLQTHFVTSSGKVIVFTVIVGQFVYIALTRLIRTKQIKATIKPIFVFNGILTGFYLLLIGNQLTTTVAIPLTLLVLGPIFYILFAKVWGKYLSSPAHLIFLGTLFFPTNLSNLLILGSICLLMILISKDRILNNPKISKLLISYIYPSVIIFLIAYNPLFYIGNFDSVEEGFWLGWLQRLINGQVLYRDVAVYHPPLIIWGMYAFTKITDFSIYNTRLFLHLLQIFGLIIYYFAVNSLLHKRINKLVVMLLAFSFTTILVKNNVEIRLGLGFLSLIIWLNYLKTKKPGWLTLSGIFCAIALFTSSEVGIAAITAVVVATTIFSKGYRIRNSGLVIFGILIGSLPFLLTFWMQGALTGFIKQLSFYSNAFANGYFNLPIERAVRLSFLRWHIFYQYLGSVAWMWEMTRMGSLATFMFVAVKAINKKVNTRDKFAITLAIFGLLLFRAILGRSDWYHLLFVLLVSLPLLIYVVENLSKKLQYLNIAVVGLLVFVFATGWVNNNFISAQIFKLQTYGKAIGTYHSYDLERSNILVGEEINTKETEKLVKYVQKEVLESETIFSYPWLPELYFLANRKNVTAFDTPYAFFSQEFQEEMIYQIEKGKPKLIIYNPEMQFGNLVVDSLPEVNRYLQENFTSILEIGPNQILELK
jgi:hypothetical protein